MTSNQGGLTLAEVLVAAAITTVGLIAVVAGFQHATSSLDASRRHTTALFLAQQRLEQVKATALVNFDGLTPSHFPGEDPVSGYPTYRRTVDITPMPAGVADAVRVQVTVAYRPVAIAVAAPSEPTVTLATVMSRRR